MWFLVGVLIAALPMLAYAETWDGAPTYAAGYPTPNVPGSSIMDACRNAEASGATGAYGGKCAVETSPGNYAQYSQRVAWSCPVVEGTAATPVPQYAAQGSQLITSVVCRYELPECEGTDVRDPATGACVPSPCEAGQTGSSSVQVGWSNVWDVNARPYGVSTPTAGCSGACKVTVTGLAEQSCYLGDSGAGAPYQVLCWYQTETTGEQCAPGDAQLSDRRDPIGCPAGTSQGTIGTKTACLPSSTSETTTTTNPDGSKTETTTTTNPDGSKTETTTTKDSSGNVIGTTTTQYPAPGAPGGSASSGTPGAGGEPQGGDDRLKECVENPEACEDGGGQFGAGAPDSSELFRRDDQVSFAGKLSKFRQDMSVTEVGQAVSGYFAVAAGGSCPTWSADIPFVQTTITIDYWCRPEMAAGMAVMKGAVLVAFGFLAFRFAVL